MRRQNFKYGTCRSELNTALSMTPLGFMLAFMAAVGIAQEQEDAGPYHPAILGVTVACMIFQAGLYPAYLCSAKLPNPRRGSQLFLISLTLTAVPAMLLAGLPGEIGQKKGLVMCLFLACHVLFMIATHYYLGSLPPVKEEAEALAADLEKRLKEVRDDLARMGSEQAAPADAR